jgi:cytoskeleton protein RodZ
VRSGHFAHRLNIFEVSSVSIGQTLSAARVAAGLSVDDVSAKSRLRATVIRAIEADDFAPCGGDFYARGHIRTYAAIVGADAAALVAEYDATVGAADEPPLSGQLIDTGASGGIGRSADRRSPRWGATAAGVALVLIIVVVSVNLLGKHKTTPHNQAAGVVPAVSPTPSTSTAAPVSSAPGLSTPTASPSVTPVASQPVVSPPTSAVADAGVQIVLKATTSKCWVLASSSDGAVLYQGILGPGESKTFADPQKISLKLGNAPATDLTVNGVDIGTPPSKGSVTSISFGPGNPTQAEG